VTPVQFLGFLVTFSSGYYLNTHFLVSDTCHFLWFFRPWRFSRWASTRDPKLNLFNFSPEALTPLTHSPTTLPQCFSPFSFLYSFFLTLSASVWSLFFLSTTKLSVCFSNYYQRNPAQMCMNVFLLLFQFHLINFFFLVFQVFQNYFWLIKR